MTDLATELHYATEYYAHALLDYSWAVKNMPGSLHEQECADRLRCRWAECRELATRKNWTMGDLVTAIKWQINLLTEGTVTVRSVRPPR